LNQLSFIKTFCAGNKNNVIVKTLWCKWWWWWRRRRRRWQLQ